MEEALKMRNLLEEFNEDHGVRRPTILGVREHIFTGRYDDFSSTYRENLSCLASILLNAVTCYSVSSLAWFMSNQETSFVTIGQRVLARPLK